MRDRRRYHASVCATRGLYLTPNRFYSPSVGRWLSPDPTGGDVMHPQSLNRYAYVDNNPGAGAEPDFWALRFPKGTGRGGKSG